MGTWYFDSHPFGNLLFVGHLVMNQSDNRARYETRLGRVLDHIYDHLDEPLDIDRLAEIACMSPYHWHRIFQAMYGETVAMTVRRLRLHRAAGYLANGSMPIGEIAERSGYSSLQSFSRTFRAVFGIPPAQYRKQGTHSRFRPALSGDDQLTFSPPEGRGFPLQGMQPTIISKRHGTYAFSMG